MMKFCLNWGGAALLSMLLLCTSCGDADLFDTDKWTNEIEGWEPGVSLKVLQGSFTLWDLINQGDDDVVVKEGNDLIIQYTEEGIYHIDIDQVFDMPAEDLEFGYSYTIPGMVSGVHLVLDHPLEIEFQTSTTLKEVPDGCELKKIQASACFMLPEIGYPYEIEATFPDIEMNGEILHITKSVPATGSESIDLNDFILTLDAEKKVDLEVNIVIPAETEVTNPDLDLIFGLNNLKFKKAEGKITTYYTCCAESHPNTYTFSNPAEGAWIAWYAAKENLDGYLRWALNSWTIEPLLDSRFYTWGAGDTYLLYPGGRTCLRFENLVAGIQAYEKIRILKTELQTQNKTATLRKLERVLESFDELQLLKTPANVVVEKANLFINGL